MGRRWTKEEDDFLKENYLPYKEIVKKLNRPAKGVYARVLKLNLAPKPRTYKYQIKEKYFDIWSHNVAYIFGFIVADGCLKFQNGYALDIGLQLRDKILLEFIRDEIAPDYILKNRVANKKHPYISFCINNKHLVKQLERMGIERAKSKNLNFRLPYCPEEFKADFLRGIFDGDGCISKVRKRGSFRIVCSSKLCVEDMQKNLGFDYGSIFKNGSCWQWQVKKYQHVQNLYHFMYYKSNVPCLQRKKNIFHSIIESPLHETWWIEEENQFLQDNYKTMSYQDVATHLNRTVGAVKTKCCRLGLVEAVKRDWIEEENQFLQYNYKTMSHRNMATHLNRTIEAVKQKCWKLGLVEAVKRYWTEEEIQFLQDNYKTMSCKDIATHLNRTVVAIKTRCWGLRLPSIK